MKAYDKAHRAAKFIVANLVCVLITWAQLSQMPMSLFLNVLAVYSWFFGVNFLAALIEKIMHYRRQHDWI